MYKVVFTAHGEKEIKTLPKDIQKRIIKKLIFFASQENFLSFSKPLVNLPPATHRFRVGDYRIAFFVVKKTICIERIAHRREMYSGN